MCWYRPWFPANLQSPFETTRDGMLLHGFVWHQHRCTELINDRVTLSMPATDTESVQEDGYKFTSKPDGERL